MNGFDPAVRIDGLEHALRTITLEKARYIWNDLLARNHQDIRGVVESATRQSYENATRVAKLSQLGQLATQIAWLPSRPGTFRKPSDLSLDDLPVDFTRHDRLAKALGMKPAIIEELARRYEVEPETLRFVIEHQAEVEELRRKLEAQAIDIDDVAPDPTDSGTEFINALTTAFDKPGLPAESLDGHERGPIANPGLRRERVREVIRAARTAEPASVVRFRRVPTRVWEAKDNRTRQLLIEEYAGQCQICREGFTKRDGQPYFEGVYLAPHTIARWIDRPGNVLCLCATCCAKFQHGTVEVDEQVARQIGAFRARNEGGTGETVLQIRLCGQPAAIHFTERHAIDLHEMLKDATGVG